MAEPTDNGATAIGLFGLADDYLKSARAASGERLSSPGPVRLLCLHACELFLKAYLRRTGSTHSEMRNELGHDLGAHAGLAIERGLDLGPERYDSLRTVTEIKAYVGSRYQAGSQSGPFGSTDAVLRLAQDVREAVRAALHLDEFGMPLRP